MESQSRTYRNAAEIELPRHRFIISKKPDEKIEVMDHLDELPATGAVIFCTFPKVRGGVGYPARVFDICPAA